MTLRPAALALLIAGLAGLASATPALAQTSAAAVGYIRVLHASAGDAAGRVEMIVDGQPAVDASWAQASDWFPVRPGQHEVSVAGEIPVSSVVDVAAGCRATVLVARPEPTQPTRLLVPIIDCATGRIPSPSFPDSSILRS